MQKGNEIAIQLEINRIVLNDEALRRVCRSRWLRNGQYPIVISVLCSNFHINQRRNFYSISSMAGKIEYVTGQQIVLQLYDTINIR